MSQYQWPWSGRPPRGRPRLQRAQHIMQIALLAAGMTLLMSPWSARRADPLQGGKSIHIFTSPPLYPPFDPDISDYVLDVNPNASIKFTAKVARDTWISVDGHPARKGESTTEITLLPGQSFSFVVKSGESVNAGVSVRKYYVRGLPSDFPAWVTERPGTPQAEWYVVTPNAPGTQRRYVIIFDNHGVPMWWYQATAVPIDAKLLPNGNVAWLSPPAYAEERHLNGTLAHTVIPVGLAGVSLHSHELLLLPNGNYLVIANQQRHPVDLSPYGGPEAGRVRDNIIEEIAPDGTLVWSWSAMDHISIAETGPYWRQQFIVNASQADPFHMDAVEPDGDGYIISFRHLDAIIRIDKASGNIVWKLGGTSRPESLQFVDDPYGNLGGQHDVRILADGTVTLHDNGTGKGRGPRGVRYRLDLDAKTATFVEQITDSESGLSGCCGSARMLPTGNWVMSWGGTPIVTELTPTGDRQFRLNFGSFYSYRAQPLLPGALSREALRAGMDARYPR